MSNATTMALALDAVVVDMTHVVTLKKLSSVFSGCTSLTSITLPPNVDDFGYNTLSGCSSLLSLDMSALKKLCPISS